MLIFDLQYDPYPPALLVGQQTTETVTRADSEYSSI